MTTKEMAASFRISRSSLYEHFSNPLYYHEEGPYLLAFDTESDYEKINLFEFLDAETFLSNPERISPVIGDADFIATALAVNLAKISHLLIKSRFDIVKIVPRTSACQKQVKKMYRTCPQIASRIFFMADSGKLSYPFWYRFTC